MNREVNNSEKNIQELKTLLLELLAKLKRFTVKSPITGYILDLKFQSPWHRIRSDEQIASIIPDKELIAQIQIPTRLRAPVYVDMYASVEVDAFPSFDFGAINSKIFSLSPTSKAASEENPKKLIWQILN